MWFAPVTVAKGSETLKQTRLATEILNKWGFDYCGEYIVGMRDMHHVIDLLFDRQKAASATLIIITHDQALADRFIQTEHGAGDLIV